MDITKRNFTSILQGFESAVAGCSFIAIDAEFSGLCEPENEIKQYDTPVRIYEKHRKSAQSFQVLQFGVSIFTLAENENRYVVKTYNFNIMPRSHDKTVPDKFFMCQSSSLAFLARQSFDFNKVFYDGISYMLPSEEKASRESMLQRHAERLTALQSKPVMPNKSPAQNKPEFINEKIKDVVNSAVHAVENQLKDEQTMEFMLEPCSFYQCRAIRDQLANKYTDLYIEIKKQEEGLSYIHIKRAKTNKEMKQFEMDFQASEVEALDEAVGFGKIISIIRSSGKLMVGHNMYLDLVHMVEQFMVILPKEYKEFKTMAQTVLPDIIDTKHLASSKTFKEHIPDTGLKSLHKHLQKENFPKISIDHAEGFDRYSDGVYLHEAGYDAYLTGLCFATMAAHLNEGILTMNIQKLLPHLNKVYLMNVFDVTHICLKSADESLKRDHVFHVTFEHQTKVPDLWKLFSPYGKTKVTFLNSNGALVTLNDRSKVHDVVEVMVGGCGDSHDARYTVTTFEQFVMSLGEGKPIPRKYKRLGSSTGEQLGSLSLTRQTPAPSSEATGTPAPSRNKVWTPGSQFTSSEAGSTPAPSRSKIWTPGSTFTPRSAQYCGQGEDGSNGAQQYSQQYYSMQSKEVVTAEISSDFLSNNGLAEEPLSKKLRSEPEHTSNPCDSNEKSADRLFEEPQDW